MFLAGAIFVLTLVGYLAAKGTQHWLECSYRGRAGAVDRRSAYRGYSGRLADCLERHGHVYRGYYHQPAA